MKVELKPDFPLTNEASKEATGKTLDEWIKYLEDNPDLAAKRRESIRHIYDQIDIKSDVWWPTTIYVEYERKNGITKKDGLLDGYTICSTKTIAAPIPDLYQAWMDRETIAKWYGTFGEPGTDGSHTDESGNKVDLVRHRENKDLRYIWQTAGVENPTQADVTFQDKGKGKTLITITHAKIQTREEADGLRNAWGEALDKLKALKEG